MDLSKNNILATLVFLTKTETGQKKVLLAKKVRKIGVGCFNGFGGSLNKNETPRSCTIRELRKESGLSAFKEDLKFKGVMTFHNMRKDGSTFTVRVYVFTLDKWRGRLKLKQDEAQESKWFSTNRLPLTQMMGADKYFVPQVLDENHQGKILRGEAWYGKGGQTDLLKFDIKWVAKTCDTN